jgi:hypothetical protein
MAGLVAAVLLWLTGRFFLKNGLSGEAARNPYLDMPFHLALAAEVKHHFPPRIPYLDGEPLVYHWFAHAHLAASSAFTGVELPVVLFRLFLFPMVIAGMLGIAVLGARVAGRPWAGPVTVIVSYFVASLAPYLSMPWAFVDLKLLGDWLWASPTQTFGCLLATPVVLLGIDRLRREPGPAAGQWAILAICLGALTGAKATYLPILCAGAGLVVAVQLLFRRRLDLAALALAAMAALYLLFATQVLFGGASYGVVFSPLKTTTQLPFMGSTELDRRAEAPLWLMLAIAALATLSWLLRGAGLAVLLRSRERWLDPAVVFLGGMTLASLAASLLFAHPGTSQIYFLVSTVPYLAALSAWGLACLIPAERAGWGTHALLASAAALAAGIVYLVMRLEHGPPPTPDTVGSQAAVLLELLEPFALLLLFLAGAAAIAWGLVRVRGVDPALAAGCVLAMTLGLGLTYTAGQAKRTLDEAIASGLEYRPQPSEGRPIAKGGIAAATWLRDHSDPDDRVATNSHCRRIYQGKCDNRHFWISAWSERRVLIEGWGYTETGLAAPLIGKTLYYFLPYWRPELLADNDRAFRSPSKASLATLRDRYGVRWLFVDERFEPPSPELGRFARLRFHRDDTSVYELTP